MMNEFQNWRKNTIRFLCSQAISLFGSSLVQYAIIWTITLQTSSGVMMSLATLCGYLPQIMISLFAGVWIDRYPRKNLIMIADGMIALSTLIVAVLFFCGYQEIWLLFVVLLVRSAGTGIQTPTVSAILPQIVPSEHLMRINGINSSMNSLIMFLSPAISGAILTFMSIEYTFFIDVITAIIGISIMLTIHVPKLQITELKQSTVNEIKAGFSYLNQHPAIKQHIIYLIVVMLLISPSAFFTPLLISRTFGTEIWRLTISEMTFSVGAVLGGVLMATWGGFKNRVHMIIFSTIGYGVMMIAIGCSPFYAIYLLFNTMIGITMPCFNAPANVYLQEQVDVNMLGRVFGIVQIANSCALPLGSAIFGPLGDVFHIQWILISCGITVILIALFRLKKFKN